MVAAAPLPPIHPHPARSPRAKAHAAGLRGLGGSSYIDSVVLRDRDTAVPWTGSSPSGDTLGERLYYAQNWRADVVALFGTDADVKEWVKYSSYGVPHSIPKGDYDLDGDVDAADTDALDLMISGAGGWNLDFNRDGNLDQDDLDAHAAYRASYSGGAGGRGVQSRSGVDNTLGYAGYHWDAVTTLNHVRHRVYLPSLGRWTRRDPAGYVDGASLFAYVTSNPLARLDPFGLQALEAIQPDGEYPCRHLLVRARDAESAVRDALYAWLACLLDAVTGQGGIFSYAQQFGAWLDAKDTARARWQDFANCVSENTVLCKYSVRAFRPGFRGKPCHAAFR